MIGTENGLFLPVWSTWESPRYSYSLLWKAKSCLSLNLATSLSLSFLGGEKYLSSDHLLGVRMRGSLVMPLQPVQLF